MNLYEITNEAQYLAALLETEELTPELEAELLINQEQLQTKAINYAKVISNYQGESDAIDAEIKRLKAMKESRDKKVTWLTDSLKKAMMVSGIEKIESPLFKISLRRSEAVEVEIPDALPVDWQVKKITITADKVAIKKAIKEGYSITGARLVENFNLSIK
jgi:Siphovirus Gp157.